MAKSQGKSSEKKVETLSTKRQLQKKVTERKCLAVIELVRGGSSTYKALKANKLSSQSFYDWLKLSAENSNNFARACEDRQELIFEQCLEIADDGSKDDAPFVGGNHVQRAKIKIQTRLDMLARMNPRKYSERHIIEGGDTPIEVVTIFQLPDNGRG